MGGEACSFATARLAAAMAAASSRAPAPASSYAADLVERLLSCAFRGGGDAAASALGDDSCARERTQGEAAAGSRAELFALSALVHAAAESAQTAHGYRSERALAPEAGFVPPSGAAGLRSAALRQAAADLPPAARALVHVTVRVPRPDDPRPLSHSNPFHQIRCRLHS